MIAADDLPNTQRFADEGSQAVKSRLNRLRFIDVRQTNNPVRRKVRPRGVPPALADNEIFYTEDVAEAARLISQALSPLSVLVAPEGGGGFAATMHGVRLRNVSMLYLDLAVAATIDIPAAGRYFAVHMPMNGQAMVEHGGCTFEANTTCSLVTSPGVPVRICLDQDTTQLLIRIEERAMTAHLIRLVGHNLSHQLAFEPRFDIATDAAMRWHAAIQLIHTEIYHAGSLVQRGQGIGSLEDLLMSTLLYLQPSNYQAEFLQPVPPGKRRAVVRGAMGYIDAHLAERITMDSVARAVHLSVRSVQQGFREELGMTPMAYVRERRLERVHEELVDAIPADEVTVTSVAQRWGFHHLGSFGAQYRKRWGESPSETLRH